MCVYLYIHNKYTQYTHIYIMYAKSFILDAINRCPALKINLIQRLNNIIFFAPLGDIFACFKQKLNFHFFNILSRFICPVNASWFKNV